MRTDALCGDCEPPPAIHAGEETLATPADGRSGCEGVPVTASEEHTPERRQDERRRTTQPAFFGENRVAARRSEDVEEPEAPQAAEPVAPVAVPKQDYDFLTGLISMEHSG